MGEIRFRSSYLERASISAPSLRLLRVAPFVTAIVPCQTNAHTHACPTRDLAGAAHQRASLPSPQPGQPQPAPGEVYGLALTPTVKFALRSVAPSIGRRDGFQPAPRDHPRRARSAMARG